MYPQRFNNSYIGGAITIMGSTRGKPIILFTGDTRYDLRETIIHEFIHAAGVGEVRAWWDFGISHDLSGYEHLDNIMQACR